MTPIGFVGFGEAASRIALGLREAGGCELYAFDIADTPKIRNRAEDARVKLSVSNAELASACPTIFSLVTAASAVEAARQNAPWLSPRHIYIDCNSVSPDRKREIARIIEDSGARFIEAAVMAPVPMNKGQSVPMLLTGCAAAETAAALAGFGFCTDVTEGGYGTAAAVKMCRSIVVKGLEAILMECVLAASRFDADERVFASLNETFPGIDWKRLADYMVNRTVVHGERRAREMEEVSATLRSIGIEPMMAEATVRRQDWAGQLNLSDRFGPEGPTDYRAVLDALGASAAGK